MPISEAESKVMEVLWRHGEALSADQVVADLASEQDWQAATVKTLLGRLLGKGAVAATRDGRRYLYRAVLPREDWLNSESQRLVNRLFGGRVAPLVAHFSRHHGLSRRDLAELRRLIGELDDKC